ncbi:hypothetical protein Q4L40_001557 [Neisseria gonorrhoeae]|nr:hypothetical protein [Neisseria gonorrhoeae]MBG9974516.1 hypothetical protein [Neisseria gonorrhoeae]
MGRRKLWFALAAAGVIGGLVGIVLTELMHFIRHTVMTRTVRTSRSAKVWHRLSVCGALPC